MRTIQRAGEHLLMLINDILDLSKIEVGRMELDPGRFPLAIFLRELVDLIMLRAREKKIDFRFEPDQGLPAVIETDELRLRQVLLNLLSNAVKFTDSGYCCLRVSARDGAGQSIRLDFVVEDTGPGISPEIQEEIFQPFYQVKGEPLHQVEGTGLGLAISRRLVRLMGGRLTLISPVFTDEEKGISYGSRFTVQLEVAAFAEGVLPAREHRSDNPALSHRQGGRGLVLVVDDIESNRRILRDTLESLGYTTCEAVDGGEVEEACTRYGPDLVMMDLRMPGVDGFEAAARLRRRPEFSGIPIVAVTAFMTGGEDLRERCLREGFNGFLGKPFSPEQLVSVLDTLSGPGQGSDCPDDARTACPPVEELEKLLVHVRAGDVDTLRKEIDRIAAARPGQYSSFMDRLRALVEEMRMMAIENLLISGCERGGEREEKTT